MASTSPIFDWSGLSAVTFAIAELIVVPLLLGIATAFGAVVLTVFYLDTRVRSEGFDLTMQFERLRDARAEGAGA